MKTLTTARTNSTDEENHSLNEKEEKRKTYKLNIARFFRRLLRKPKDKSMFIAVDDRSIDGRGVEKELTSPPLILSCVMTSLKDQNYSDNERMISVDSKQSRGDTTPSEAIVAFGDYGSMSSIGTTRDYMPDDNILGSYEYRSFYSRSSDGLTTVDFENDDTVGDNTYGMSSHEYSSSFLRSSFFRRRKERDVEERIFHINAPPGKLGISMDTPNDGAVVIQAIKDSCPIRDQLQVGDRMISLDNEDIRFCTAVAVSKMISRKSFNHTRKLTVIRTIASEDNDSQKAVHV